MPNETQNLNYITETPEDEDRIERDVDEVSGKVDPEHKTRPPLSGEIGRRGHLSVNTDRTEHQDVIIGPFVPQEIGRSHRHGQDPVPERNQRNRKKSEPNRQRQRDTISRTAHPFVTRAMIASHEDRRVPDDALEEPGEHPHQHSRRQHRLQGPHRVVRQIHAVNELHDRIVDHAERQRPHESQNLTIRLHSTVRGAPSRPAFPG